ncbi:SDR family NAD(P)-dependent oxidoreductase [Tomitella fengzijianii]|uniref:SDR family oxidoreductase n=1 Tax=Tomitella fengzijianii TaxID=2597660 RepID=A0A516X703_9ACTN|nr:SDR family oxidoreductase [Tomitella fengzijianii]QDQ98793.1 SDR family oxidoreductase [Tomitella fengzijianii]
MAARLEGKIALVTGGGQGIGRGTCLALAREGAKVVVAGRTEGKCVAVAEEIAAFGGIAEPIRCDVTSPDDLSAAIDRTVQVFGGLTTLVNNAQTVRNGPLAEATDDDLRVVWESGPLATMHAMQSAFPHLRDAGDAAIVNFGSSTAVRGTAGFGVYAMAKEAIRGLSRVAAAEWGRHGIRVNVVVPNALSPTAAAFDAAEPDRLALRQARIPLGRVGDAELDIGRAVVGLAGADFTYMSGQTLMLTGGE